MLNRLRSATRASHAALEGALDLLRPPLDRARYIAVLQGFHSFHLAWEPHVARLIGDEPLLAPRRRLALLQRDLAALGSGDAGAARLDVAFDPITVAPDTASAWGSLYVMEGSTLGGQVISKALRRTPWAPMEGLSYFNPYGVRNAMMWADFCEALEAAAAGLPPEQVEAGACATFIALQHGLAPQMEAAA